MGVEEIFTLSQKFWGCCAPSPKKRLGGPKRPCSSLFGAYALRLVVMLWFYELCPVRLPFSARLWYWFLRVSLDKSWFFIRKYGNVQICGKIWQLPYSFSWKCILLWQKKLLLSYQWKNSSLRQYVTAVSRWRKKVDFPSIILSELL